MIYTISRFFCFLAALIFFRFRSYGARQVPLKGPVIIAANHVSFLDPVMAGIAVPRRIHYLARESLFHNRFFGWYLKRLNCIPLKRGTSDFGALRQALRCLAQGEGLLLFPEGTRGDGIHLGEALSGLGFLVRKSRAPVVPVFVQGSDRVLPRGARMFKPSPVRVLIGPVLHFDSFQALSDIEISREVMRHISQLQKTPGK